MSAIAISRRQLLSACAVLGLVACDRFPGNTRLAQDAIGDPEPRDWQHVMRGITRATIAFEHPRFPKEVTPEEADRTVLSHFDLTADDFASLRRGLAVFDDTALFSQRLAPLVADERNNVGTSDDDIDRAARHDADLAGTMNVRGRFVDLSLDDQRRYLRAWGRSGFLQRRRFYRGVKSIVMVSTYSLPALWRTIGYDGPLLTLQR